MSFAPAQRRKSPRLRCWLLECDDDCLSTLGSLVLANIGDEALVALACTCRVLYAQYTQLYLHSKLRQATMHLDLTVTKQTTLLSKVRTFTANLSEPERTAGVFVQMKDALLESHGVSENLLRDLRDIDRSNEALRCSLAREPHWGTPLYLYRASRSLRESSAQVAQLLGSSVRNLRQETQNAQQHLRLVEQMERLWPQMRFLWRQRQMGADPAPVPPPLQPDAVGDGAQDGDGGAGHVAPQE